MRIKKRFLIPLILLLILPLFTSGCFTFRASTQELEERFQERRIPVDIKTYTVEGREVRYAATGNPDSTHIIFFHGAPGSLTAFEGFLANSTLTKHHRLISVDRPGYGYSGFGNSIVSLKAQSIYLKELLDLNTSGQPTILVGHSLGGPIIARMAIDYPELIDGLVFVGASVDPDLEPNEAWFRKPLYTPFLRWILPISFRVTNDEILFLEDQLREMELEWNVIEAHTVIVHGGEDLLVPVGNVTFMKDRLVNAASVEGIVEDKVNHFIPWSRPDMILEAISRIKNRTPR